MCGPACAFYLLLETTNPTSVTDGLVPSARTAQRAQDVETWQKEVREGAFYADMGRMFELLGAWAAAALRPGEGVSPSRGPGRPVVVREVSAQHFRGTGSYVSWEQGHTASRGECGCEAMPAALIRNNTVTVQNAILHELAARHRLVRIMPYYDLTSARWDMHLQSHCDIRDSQMRCICDCTHYCYTPAFWRHAFDAMVRSLEASLEEAAREAPLLVQPEG